MYVHLVVIIRVFIGIPWPGDESRLVATTIPNKTMITTALERTRGFFRAKIRIVGRRISDTGAGGINIMLEGRKLNVWRSNEDRVLTGCHGG